MSDSLALTPSRLRSENVRLMGSPGHEVWSAGGYYFWIPMVAPFCGCVFGGVLYDFFIYTGPSPINTAWFGLLGIIHPKRTAKERVKAQKEEGLV